MTESGQAWADLGPSFACLGGYVGSAWAGGTPVLASSSTSAPPCCAALANKMVRIAWALTTKEEFYRAPATA